MPCAVEWNVFGKQQNDRREKPLGGIVEERILPAILIVAARIEEYAKLLSEKKTAYPDYRKAKQEMQELLTVQANVAKILGAEPREAEHEKEQKQR